MTEDCRCGPFADGPLQDAPPTQSQPPHRRVHVCGSAEAPAQQYWSSTAPEGLHLVSSHIGDLHSHLSQPAHGDEERPVAAARAVGCHSRIPQSSVCSSNRLWLSQTPTFYVHASHLVRDQFEIECVDDDLGGICIYCVCRPHAWVRVRLSAEQLVSSLVSRSPRAISLSPPASALQTAHRYPRACLPVYQLERTDGE